MWNDVRFALRTFRRSPGFAVLAVLSLALGMGASTAIFSLLYQVVLRALPVRDPGSLVWLETDDNNFGYTRRDTNLSIFSYPMYEALRDHNRVFSGLVARTGYPATLAWRGEAARATAEVVSGNFFEVLGVSPALGRLLAPSDDRADADAAVVLSYGYWRDHFGGSPEVLNSRLLMNGKPVTVVGVARRGMRGLVTGRDPDLYAPLARMALVSPGWRWNGRSDYYFLNLVGRLKPGVSRERADAELLPLFRSILREEVPAMEGMTADGAKHMLAKPLAARPAAQGLNALRARWQTPLTVLAVMVGLVLLIACANVASLLIARATARQREIGIRLAIGATRGRISRQLLVESGILALAGGTAGLLLSQTLTEGLLSVLPADTTGGWLAPQLDWRLLGFSMALAFVSAVIFGLAPALQATRAGVAPALKEMTAGMSASRGQARSRQVLMAAQICVSLLLLVGAGLFTRSLLNLLHSDPGFRASHLITFSIDPSLSGYTTERRLAFFRDLRERLGRLPGVQLAANAWVVPLGGWNWGNGVQVPGSGKDEYVNCNENSISPGYFATLGIPLEAGRDFSAADSANAPQVVILSAGLARKLFPDGRAVGRHVRIGSNNLTAEVVGIVRDARMNDVREKMPPVLYAPFEQGGEDFTKQSAFFVRSAGGGQKTVMAAIRAAVKQMDRNLPIDGLTSMTATIDDSIYTDRLLAMLAIAFGVLAAALAAVGLYGTVSYSVARRTREFGIRLVLGEQPSGLLAAVLREVGTIVAIGAAAGLPLSYALGRLAESELSGIRAHDAATLAGATLLIALVGLCAGAVPAWRAMRIQPVTALRYE